MSREQEKWEVNGGTDVWFGDDLCVWVGTEERANLIAAAPELYTALDSLVRALALKEGDLMVALNSAAAILLKAKGDYPGGEKP